MRLPQLNGATAPPTRVDRVDDHRHRAEARRRGGLRGRAEKGRRRTLVPRRHSRHQECRRLPATSTLLSRRSSPSRCPCRRTHRSSTRSRPSGRWSGSRRGSTRRCSPCTRRHRSRSSRSSRTPHSQPAPWRWSSGPARTQSKATMQTWKSSLKSDRKVNRCRHDVCRHSSTRDVERFNSARPHRAPAPAALESWLPIPEWR